MKKKFLFTTLFISIFIVFCCKSNTNQQQKKQTQDEQRKHQEKPQKPGLLFEYATRDDGEFSMEKVAEEKFSETTIHEIKIKSQRWKDIIWTHYILIAQPKNITTKTALLIISGGNINYRGKKEHREAISKASEQLSAIVAILFNVPNQPLFGNLREDDLISYTFVKALTTSDLEWGCLLPMVKSVVKTMDTIQKFSNENLNIKIDGFVVTGASKRGWTTWLTAAVDNRITGIMPRVFDNLNIPVQMNHQIEVFGKHSDEIQEYTKRGLTFLATSIVARPIVQLVDPYSYKGNIKIPKIVVNGTNDRYWTLDAANFYFDDLDGEKYIQYIPNCGHSLEDQDRVLNTTIAFFNYLCSRTNFPKFEWNWIQKNEDMELIIKPNSTPKRVLIWTASSNTKNFHDSKWKSFELNKLTNSEYSYILKKPEKGYSSAFAELFFETNSHEFSLTTTLRIIGAK